MRLFYFAIVSALFLAQASSINFARSTNLFERQLFLSRRVVTEAAEFDGGVLVDEFGIIEAVLTRATVDTLLAAESHRIKVIDGGELALMAGVVDPHVHVNEPGRTSWEGFVFATQAAAAGGITTIIDTPLNSIPPTTSVQHLKTKVNSAKGEIFVDVGFWGGIIPGNEIELHDLIRAGVVGLQAFLIDSGVPEFPRLSPQELESVLLVLNGTGTVLAFHAELLVNNRSYSYSHSRCSDCPCSSGDLYSTYLASRPAEMELAAVSLIARYLPITDVHAHILHVSAEGVVPIIEQARAARVASGHRGWRAGITAETCHHYLTLSDDQIPPGHTEYKTSPPIRDTYNKKKLWDYIREERLDLITSDHSPVPANLKGLNFMSSWGGISSLQFGLSLFWTEASARGYGLSAATHYLSSGPARLTGLSSRKGALRPGLDADLIFFDPNASFVVTPEVIQYKNKISPYMHRVLRGKVIETYLRGQLIFAGDSITQKPKGQLLVNSDLLQ